MEIILLLVVVIVLDIVALRWGFNSTDSINSPEWERRKCWGFSSTHPAPGDRCREHERHPHDPLHEDIHAFLAEMRK